MLNNTLEIRECTTLEDLAKCVDLQREVFRLPEVELSPVRHLVVTRSAGGFTLGAFDGGRLAGFVLSVPAFLRGEKAFYSHMAAVLPEYQGTGVGSRLKWAQRDRAISEGVRYVKWTFEPIKAKNAHFNLEKLGAVVRDYKIDFYGVDYASSGGETVGLASDRLFAEWDLLSEKVRALAQGKAYVESGEPAMAIDIPADWPSLVNSDVALARSEQLAAREKFLAAFAQGLIGRSFDRSGERPRYLLFRE